MSEISEAAKAKACELTNVQGGATYHPKNIGPETPRMFAFARFIQQVDFTVRVLRDCADLTPKQIALLDPLILPDPVDPLWEPTDDALVEWNNTAGNVETFRQLLAKRGLKIVEAS